MHSLTNGGAKLLPEHQHLGETQVARTAELHAHISALRGNGSNKIGITKAVPGNSDICI